MESRNVAQHQAEKPADRGVGQESVAQCALRVVELQLPNHRSIENDQCVSARRVAAVLHAIARVGHRLDDRDQDGHEFRSAARHHAVDSHVPDRGGAPVGEHHAEHFIRIPIREAQELLNRGARGRHDRQAVRKGVCIEVAVHVGEAARDDDRPRARFGAFRLRSVGARQRVDHTSKRRLENVVTQLRGTLGAHVAWHQRERDIAQTQSDGRCGGLFKESLAGERRGGKSGDLACSTRPQHGGRAAASAGHARDDCIDPQFAKTRRQLFERFFFACAMGASENFPAHELDVGKLLPEAFLQQFEDLVAFVELIPELGDALASQRVEPGGKCAGSLLELAAGPVRLKIAVVLCRFH